MQEAWINVQFLVGMNPRATIIRQIQIFLTTLIVLLFALPAHAQNDPANGYEVQLGVVNFGIGGLAREGEWIGVLAQVQDTGSSSRDIVLRLEITDVDGDITQYDRVITANPGVLQSFWLYCQLPYQSIGDEYMLKAFEAVDSGGVDSPAEIGFRAGKLLGQMQVVNPRIMTSRVGMIGVVGSNQVGLDQYGFSRNQNYWMPYGHELQRVSAGLTISGLPDRWQGLKTLNSLVWSTSTTSSYDPGRLTPEKARAIREWVLRGGHLVIVMQSSGDPWFQGAHPLRSILPSVQVPSRMDGVSLDRYRSLLTESDVSEMPDNAVVYAFEPIQGVEPTEALPILNDPNGETVVTRRLLGSGMVTVVGLPLNHGRLRRLGLPDAESFWHRVLGMRGRVVRAEMMTEQEKSDTGSRNTLVFDNGISGAISKTGTAVQGVLFGIVVFVVYWLLAGPLGYALLKQRKMKQHSWVGFVICIVGFTAIAWLGATTLRPKQVTVSHFTLIEQVHGQDTQRARSWFSVMLPSYGEATLSTVDPDVTSGFGAQESTNILIPWSAPESGGALTGGFPDNSGYRVQSRAPAAVTVPTRATVKTFAAEWAGKSDWALPYVVTEIGASEEARLTLDGSIVNGQIAHGLPGNLSDVTVFVIRGMRPINRPGVELGSASIANVAVYKPRFGDDDWAPNTSIDLSEITSLQGMRESRLRDDYFTTSINFGSDMAGLSGGRGSIYDRLLAGRFITQFTPPNFKATNDIIGDKLAIRRLLHGWDMGKWFTQPAVIVTGVLVVDNDEAATASMPVPVWVDGKRVPASGSTLVTWIYPFEASPPTYSVERSGDRVETPNPDSGEDEDDDVGKRE